MPAAGADFGSGAGCRSGAGKRMGVGARVFPLWLRSASSVTTDRGLSW
jgi:hypothetical protein